jgi:Asp-tRNA(Asn)/Glu-tRNA(Gln) amidotransferase A subunit family amidase
MVAPPLAAEDDVTRAGRNTRLFNALAWPAISIPVGSADGLPAGLMLAALPGRDRELLGTAALAETVIGPSAALAR